MLSSSVHGTSAGSAPIPFNQRVTLSHVGVRSPSRRRDRMALHRIVSHNGMRTPQAAHLEMNAAYPEFKKVRCDLQVLLTAGSYRTRGRVAKLTKREWREKCARRLS